MSLLEIEGLTHSFGENLLYKNAGFTLNKGELDLCQYFEHKKLKGYADFFNSSSSFCCGVI